MKISRLSIIAILLLALSGCQGTDEAQQTAFVLSKEDRTLLTEAVDKALYDMYWRYDAETLSFMAAVVPQEEAVFEAAAGSGYIMDGYAGREVVAATAELLHFNGDRAGLGHFYFVRNKLIGAYYTGGYADQPTSLQKRNLFLADGKFSAYESDKTQATFRERKISFPAEGPFSSGISSRNEPVCAVLIDGEISVYRYTQGNMRKERTLSLNGRRAFGAAYLSDGTLAVLVGRTISEGEEEEQTLHMSSEAVVFFNSSSQRTGEELTLSSPNYTGIGADEDALLLANGTILEYYTQSAGTGFVREQQFFMEHSINQIHKTDLDQNGVAEYLMTNGQDLYVYQKNADGFLRLWQTHLGVESLTGVITTGDLNQDGVLEVYVGDNTGTVIRYVLTPDGLMPRNEDIVYGDRFFALMLNEDDKWDYIGIQDIEKQEATLYLSE